MSKKRQQFTIEEKLAIVCRLENGENNVSIAKERCNAPFTNIFHN